jgi:hypothetical protein
VQLIKGPLDPPLRHRAGGAQRLREQADPEILDHPAHLAGVGIALL